MNIDPQLAVLVHELGNVMAFDDLALDGEGACAVRFDGRTVVNLQCLEAQDKLWLFADLGPVNGSAELYADLLRGGNTVGAFNWDGVRSLAAGAGGKDPSGYRAEFLDLVDRASHVTGDGAPLALGE